MAERERIKTSTVTLDIELQDLLDVVSKSGNKPPLSTETTAHSMEGEDLKKAWFKHVLISMEKLNDQVESIRRIDIVDVQNEFKISINDLKEFIKRVETKVDKAEDELKVYKKEVLAPLSDKVLTLAVKIGVYSVIAGFVGSGLMGIIVYVIKEYVIKSAITGGR
jgi:hypothetical protein